MKNLSQHECQICLKNFTQKKGLKRHMRIHTGERPYACTFGDCEKKFSTVGAYIRHMRIHTGERPYACPYCDWKFVQSNQLKKHVIRAHKTTIDLCSKERKSIASCPT